MSDHIHEYWEAQARIHGGAAEASWGDGHMISLEVLEISKHLPDTGTILDVGCANGHATERIAAMKTSAQFFAVDFSESMIQQATQTARSNTEYSVADARDLPFECDTFDASFTTRMLINLSTWKQQQQAIDELMRVTRPGGRIIICEAFWEPLAKLNAVRLIAGLDPLVEHDFNRYLKMSKLLDFLNRQGKQPTVSEFSSIYYLGTRFLRELATHADGYPGYSNPINSAFFDLEEEWSGGPFSVQSVVVLEN